ncbi:ATP-binding protein [Streptomyces sp. NBC_01803]|uniref:ATP-binding protein n=1 Tax=Streptomyces sp. NBC_01803 TaxID=2975946 RepID=UPI002DDC6DAD|nr:ATP-binding protein [Streptomyces sp. NBC_01803]WSA45590.1 ATP-binding protein [Streptomyces sp. NBC_01803]
MGTNGTPMLDLLGRQFLPADLRTLSSTATLGLPPRPESVRQARDFTRNTLQGWRLPELFDGVALVVSELVTNALRHGAHTREADFEPAAPSTVELELMRCARRLICAVQDPSDASPRLGSVDGSAESGRGLHLVECFSDGWGWRPLTGGRHGKVVWAVFQTV